MKLAFIFPGQGAQYAGMGKEFYDQFAESRRIFETASDVLSMDMKELCFEQNERLDITAYTQAAMLTVSAAMLAVIEAEGVRADAAAGLSLGEYGAILAGKAMSFADAVAVVRKRGILMQEAVPAGGAMAAVMGTDAELIRKICGETEGIVSVANYNCPGQIVITGEENAVAKACESLKEAGARRTVPLKVSGPFHSKLLEHAGRQLEEVLRPILLRNPQIPYITNVTAEYVTDSEEIKPLLGRQVYSSVLWQQSVERLIADGIDTFLEIGPGRTLSGFVKKIHRDAKVMNIEKPDDLKKVMEEMKC
ncbi:ACP S-malonyltransferase [Diplocloster hominis]|uniref:ACP S-malonyltransferase n=1 Tax=Diplocloster hominis TaxID=3079010 RepID=UPI0031BBA986